MNMGMTKIEAVLTMGIRHGKDRFRQECAVFPMLIKKRGSWNRGIQHELVKYRIMTDGFLDYLAEVFGGVIFHSNANRI